MLRIRDKYNYASPSPFTPARFNISFAPTFDAAPSNMVQKNLVPHHEGRKPAGSCQTSRPAALLNKFPYREDTVFAYFWEADYEGTLRHYHGDYPAWLSRIAATAPTHSMSTTPSSASTTHLVSALLRSELLKPYVRDTWERYIHHEKLGEANPFSIRAIARAMSAHQHTVYGLEIPPQVLTSSCYLDIQLAPDRPEVFTLNALHPVQYRGLYPRALPAVQSNKAPLFPRAGVFFISSFSVLKINRAPS